MEFYTAKEVAKMTKQNPKTVRRHIREGKLKAFKIGNRYKITTENLYEYMTGEEKEEVKIEGN